jgi:multidrug resistance efflux pump
MKSLIARTVLIAALALTGNAAMAANAPAHKSAGKILRPHAALRVAPRLPNSQQADIGQFIQSMFGGGWPMQDAMRARPSRRSRGSSDGSASYDNSPTVDTSSSGTDAQAASDAESQAIQSMNDENALNASTAAAEAANDAANAATLQTEINAGF